MKKLIVSALVFLLSAPAFSQTLIEAKKLLENEQFDAASTMLLQLIAKEPANPVNYYYLADKLLIQDRTDSAVKMLDQGSLLDSTNAFIKIGRAKELLSRGNAVESRAAADKDPSNEALKRIAAETDKNVSKALSLIDQVVAGAPSKNPTLYIECAEALIRYKNKNLDKAKSLLERAEKIDQKNVEIKLLFGDIYTELNNGSLAAQYYNDALQLDPASPRALVSKGLLYHRSTNYEQAKEAYQEAIKINANYAPAYRGLGESYYKLGKLEDAKAAYKKYLELSGNSCYAEIRYAGFLFLSKDFTGAQATVQQIRQHCDATNVLPVRISAYAQYELKDYSKALVEIEQLFAMVPEDRRNAKDYEYYGKTLIALNRDSAGILMLRSAIALDPVRYDLVSDLGAAYMKIKDYPNAILVFSKKLADGREFKALDYFNMGKSYFYESMFTDADKSFAKLNEVSPKFTTGYYWRGRTLSFMDSSYSQGLANPHYDKFIELATVDSASTIKNTSLLSDVYKYYAIYSNVMKDKDKTLYYLHKRADLNIDPEEKKAILADIKDLESKK